MFGLPILSSSTQELIGNGLLLISTVGVAATVLHGKSIITNSNIIVVLGSRFMITGLVAAGIALVFEDPFKSFNVPLDAMLWLLGSTLIGGAWSIYVTYKSLTYVRAEDVSVLFYLDPLVGVLGGAIILGETLSGPTFIAAAIMLCGVFIAHPVHLTRTVYYKKTTHSTFEEFMHWARKEYESMNHFMRKFF